MASGAALKHLREAQPGRESSRPSLILIDDDPLIVDSLSFLLAPQFDVHCANSRSQARGVLQSLAVPPTLALVDLGLPPKPHAPDEGFALITELLAFNRAMKILVLSGQNNRLNIQHALTLGAVDFLPKPCDGDLLLARLRHQLMLLDAEQTSERPGQHTEELLIGSSTGMTTLRALIKQFANSPFPVLIEGESGGGKELVAQCLHRESRRAAAPLLALNCAAFTPALLEAQLFGAARGAYTGADRARGGFFEEVGSGTLFLDEVGEMPLELQTRFLRVLENGEYYRLGETQARRAEARILAATNRDLRDAVRRGQFRADLFHRLSVLTVSVPPLRSRGDDWRELLAHFQRQYADTVSPFTLSAQADALLAAYSFPGNVRELRNIVIRLGTRYPGSEVSAAAMAQELESQLGAPAEPADAAAAPALRGRLLTEGFRLDEELATLERQYVTLALELAHGNLSRAARLLGVNRTTLYSKLARLGLNPPQE
jgi:DNA-binding NtrC family response regulator